MLPRPPELHDAASRASSEEFPAQPDSRYHDPLLEWSQGFDMTLPFDGQDGPLPYLQDADPYGIDSAWLAAEQSHTESRIFCSPCDCQAAGATKGSIKAKSTSWHELETTNVVDTQADPREYASFTPDSETTVWEPVPSGSKSTRQRKTSKRAAVPEAPSGDHHSAETRENGDDLLAFPFQHPRRPMCGDVFYTICHPSPQHEFHYRRSMNVCVEAAADIVHSCNRGDNRFVSLTHCRQRCVRVGRRPADECFGEPLFTNCARQDVVSNWWFFDGRKCTPWNFPSGGCPANDSAVFRTAEECRRQCVTAGLGSSPCRLPGAVACERQHLKYPFFADLSVRDGLFRCLRSSPDVLRDRRCLTGSNRFRTLEACKVTCQKAPTA
ncbi:hypothetical protein HPB50_020668 [Hyalomma asiaticum]|uniref:Uncharacterized protein n=1 Tax=Hyalomma asiaticum TaxID=266040 RepID=A0ACB7SHT4_HYAAI|nr:hypothetical protein HPB50_020668 [Hyalomma asiaticum]